MYYEVIPGGRVERLTYDFDGDSLVPGQIVLVPVGKRVVPGVVVKKVAQPEFKTRTILKVLYSKVLPTHLLKTIEFIHEYYNVPSGLAVSLVLPKGVEKKRRKTEQMFGINLSTGPVAPSSPKILQSKHFGGPPPGAPPVDEIYKTEQGSSFPEIRLNVAQKKALEGLYKAPGATRLLHGVTGSGKTNIYLKMASRALSEQKSTILLVPEIALTGQLVRVFREVFGGKVVLIHSRQTEAERHLIFNSLLETEEPRIVVGPRSALFAPVSNLGLILIDEEHESTYYQENAPKYSAIRVASFMAKTGGFPLILGSATPTLEDYYLASRAGSVVELTEKAKEEAIRPEIRIIDFKNRDNYTKNKYFSNSLLSAISANLEQGRQTLIFHNRRGSSPLTICENCGHTCGFSLKVPVACPKCGTPGLVHKGFGTKLLESELLKLFPKARIRRFDADNKKGEGLEAVYTSVRDGEVDILVGTQTLAKGLDLPRLATVGVVQADAGLSLPDFAAEERTFQLLTQVIGRVGRGHLDSAEVFIQTFRPEHPVLGFAVQEDYRGFYEYALKMRQKSGFPPFKFIMRLEITMKTEATTLRKVRETAKELSLDSRLLVSSPLPAFHERTAAGFTWQIIVRSRSRKALLEACEGLDASFKVTLDPPSLL